MRVYTNKSKYEKIKNCAIKSDKVKCVTTQEKEEKDSLMPIILDYLKDRDTISASRIQSEFSIGYPRARKIMQQLIEDGYIEERTVYIVVKKSLED